MDRGVGWLLLTALEALQGENERLLIQAVKPRGILDFKTLEGLNRIKSSYQYGHSFASPSAPLVLASFLSLFHSPWAFTPGPGITFHVNKLHPSPCLRLCFRKEFRLRPEEAVVAK